MDARCNGMRFDGRLRESTDEVLRTILDTCTTGKKLCSIRVPQPQISDAHLGSQGPHPFIHVKVKQFSCPTPLRDTSALAGLAVSLIYRRKNSSLHPIGFCRAPDPC